MVNIKKINLVRIFNLTFLKKPAIYLICAGVFIVSNLLISGVALRGDFSMGKAYTLSSSTRKIITHADKQVKINFYVSDDIPSRLIALKSDIVDLLNEYKRQGSKISLKITDPKRDEEAKKDTDEAGIAPMQVSQLESGKYAVTQIYFGILINYGDKKEVIHQVADAESLEYNLTAAIYKLTNKNIPQISILGGDSDPYSGQDSLSALKNLLQQQLEMSFITPSEEEGIKIDGKAQALLLFDNKTEYKPEEIKVIQDYLDKGGKAIMFVDGVWVENLSTAKSKSNLISLIEKYGIKVNDNLLLSYAAETVNFGGNSNVSFFLPYPFWLKAADFNQKTAYFSNVRQLTYPWVSSLTVEKKEGVEIKELVRSSKTSWEQKDNINLDPQAITEPDKKNLKSYLIAASAKKGKSEIVVIPTSRFASQNYLSPNSGNMEFILNLVNELSSSGALSGIRQRSVPIFPLPDIADSQKDMFRYSNILAFPILFAIYGSLRLMKRK